MFELGDAADRITAVTCLLLALYCYVFLIVEFREELKIEKWWFAELLKRKSEPEEEEE